VIAGIGGILLVSSTGGFDASGSAGYLLPALAAVFLGTAVVQPGQFNPIGTLIGIYFLETRHLRTRAVRLQRLGPGRLLRRGPRGSRRRRHHRAQRAVDRMTTAARRRIAPEKTPTSLSEAETESSHEVTITEESTSRYVQTKKWRMHYNEIGEGPPLILLHGSGPVRPVGATSARICQPSASTSRPRRRHDRLGRFGSRSLRRARQH